MMMMMMMINTWLVGGKPLWCQLAILWAWPPTTGTRDYRSGRDLKSVNNKSSASVTSQRGLIEMSECRQWLEERFLSIQQDELSNSEGIMHIVITIIMHIRILRIDNFIKSLLWHYAGNFFLPMWRNPNSGVPNIFACGIRNPEMFSCKFGILAFCRVWNTALGIRNPTNHWNQESQFHWQESGIQSLESGIRSLESTVQDCLWFPYLPIGLNPLGCVFPLTGQEIWKRSFFDEKGKQIQVDYWSNQERGHLCLFWQLKISSVLIPGWQRFDSSVRRMRCIFPLSNLKRFVICMIPWS